MNLREYFDWLADKYAGYFDVQRDCVVLGRVFPVYAVSQIRSDKYFASKKISLGGYENLEHCLVHGRQEALDQAGLEEFMRVLKNAVDELVKPHHEHMSTTITGVLVAERGIAPGTVKRVHKFSLGRTYRWGLHGWSRVRLILVDLATGQVHANKKGREVVYSYRVPPLNTAAGRRC